MCIKLLIVFIHLRKIRNDRPKLLPATYVSPAASSSTSLYHSPGLCSRGITQSGASYDGLSDSTQQYKAIPKDEKREILRDKITVEPES